MLCVPAGGGSGPAGAAAGGGGRRDRAVAHARRSHRAAAAGGQASRLLFFFFEGTGEQPCRPACSSQPAGERGMRCGLAAHSGQTQRAGALSARSHALGQDNLFSGYGQQASPATCLHLASLACPSIQAHACVLCLSQAHTALRALFLSPASHTSPCADGPYCILPSPDACRHGTPRRCWSATWTAPRSRWPWRSMRCESACLRGSVTPNCPCVHALLSARPLRCLPCAVFGALRCAAG